MIWACDPTDSQLRPSPCPQGSSTISANNSTGIQAAGLFKSERVITTPQDAKIEVAGREQGVLNLCANNYLGLAEHPEILKAAHEGLDRWGYGMASVRFICGTQSIHKQLESTLSEFLGTDDTILYSSCFDANGGLFETLLTAEGCGHFRPA